MPRTAAALAKIRGDLLPEAPKASAEDPLERAGMPKLETMLRPDRETAETPGKKPELGTPKGPGAAPTLPSATADTRPMMPTAGAMPAVAPSWNASVVKPVTLESSFKPTPDSGWSTPLPSPAASATPVTSSLDGPTHWEMLPKTRSFTTPMKTPGMKQPGTY